MQQFNLSAPADFYYSGARRPHKVIYRKFARGAEAIRYAMEDMPQADLRGVVVESDEVRLGPVEIEELYWSASYPLARKAAH